MKTNMKTKNRIAVLLVLIFQSFLNAQVGVNIVTPHPTAAMQIENPAGFNKGLLTPSMTTTQRLAVNTGTVIAADGLVVYDVTYKMHFMFNAANKTWVSMSPLTLSTPSNAAIPNTAITTPATMSTTAFNVGINKQNPTQALDVVGNSTVSGNAAVGGSLNVAGFASNALVPTGLIAMWSGSLVPLGWALCNGEVHLGFPTPDLSGRFIVSLDFGGAIPSPSNISIPPQQIAFGLNTQTLPTVAPNDGTTKNYGKIGNTGGETGHQLSRAELPQHNHRLSNNDGANTSTPQYGDMGLGANQRTDVMSTASGIPLLGNSVSGVVPAERFAPTVPWPSYGAVGQLGFTGDGSHNASGVLAGLGGLNNQIHENRPPYYVLAYIIKLP